MQQGKRGRAADWDGRRVRALRKYLGLTQQEMAQELGTRQQTVSEWETGLYRPRGVSSRLLHMVAERAGFAYDPRTEPPPGEEAPPRSEG
jgi:DNA-binding transcriptional regulator YiaG